MGTRRVRYHMVNKRFRGSSFIPRWTKLVGGVGSKLIIFFKIYSSVLRSDFTQYTQLLLKRCTTTDRFRPPLLSPQSMDLLELFEPVFSNSILTQLRLILVTL